MGKRPGPNGKPCTIQQSLSGKISDGDQSAQGTHVLMMTASFSLGQELSGHKDLVLFVPDSPGSTAGPTHDWHTKKTTSVFLNEG